MVERRDDACSTDVENGDGLHGVSSGGTTGARGERGRRQGCRCGAKPGADEAVLAGGAARGRPEDGTSSPMFAGGERRHGENREGGERWSEGKLVNNSKFQSAVCKFSFSPST